MKRKFIFLIVSCSDLNKNNAYYNSQDKYPLFKKMNKMCYDLFKDDINYFFVEYNMIHTNLTSLWNIPVLLSLHSEIPKLRCFAGHFIFNSFITGTGIIISHDLTPLLLQIHATSAQPNEDVAISRFMLTHGIPVYHLENLEKYKMNYQVLDENEKNPSSPHHKNYNLEINENTYTNNILYFRIKNSTIQQDFFVAKNIIKKLYNINF